MDTIAQILHGFSVAASPVNLGYTFVGCLLGTVVGVLPGLGPSAAMGLLIPVTFGMDPTSALILMAGIFYGSMYGGSTTSILINTPGEAASVMTALDGHQMAKNGRAGAALAVSAIASFIAGTLGIIGLTALAVPLADFALKFGPAEEFCLMIFSLTAVSSLTGTSVAKGIISTVIGLMIATIGIDLQSGQPRYTGGIPDLYDGIGFLIVAVGLFAIGEVLSGLEDLIHGKSEIIRLSGPLWLTREEWRRSIMPILRGGVIGFFKGILPGAGATISTMISYTIEKRISKEPEKFGTGMIEGVAGPEAANNAATCGAMVPLLALGIPGSGAMAILMGAFIMYGIQPGPMLFERNPDVVWGLVQSMYIGNVMLLVLNLPLVGVFVRILYIPIGILLPMILVVTTVGIYSLNGSTFELYLALGFGLLGFIFRKLDIPLAPMVLSVVLGGLMEQSFRQSMTISGGNPVIFVSSALCIALLVLAVLFGSLPLLLPRLRQWQRLADSSDE